jgi:hypothetical protein
LSAIRLIIVTRQVAAAIETRRMLEASGAFEVLTFTTGRAALRDLATAPADAIWLDLDAPGESAELLLAEARRAQPGLRALLAPDTDVVRALAPDLRARVEALPPASEDAIAGIAGYIADAPQAGEAPARPATLPEVPPAPLEEFGTARIIAEYLIADTDGAVTPINSNTQPFERLRGPAVTTIADLGETLAGEPRPPVPEQPAALPPEPALAAEDTVPHLVLHELMDTSTPIEAFSLASFMARVESAGQGQIIRPLPSWVMAELKVQAVEDSADWPTAPYRVGYVRDTQVTTMSGAVLEDIVTMETDRFQVPIWRTHLTPERTAPTAPPPEAETGAEAERPAADAAAPTLTREEQIAAMALVLTETSLETAADAVLLLDEGRIVAMAGPMIAEDVSRIHRDVGDDWDAPAGQGRIRFVTLASTGQDYLLYSHRTVQHMTLAMIFAGDRRLTAIRQQWQRVAGALAVELPEGAQPETDAPPPAHASVTPPELPALPEVPRTDDGDFDAAARQRLAFAWLAQPDAVAGFQALGARLAAELETGLLARGWGVSAIELREGQLLATVDAPAQVAVPELMAGFRRYANALAATLAPPALETPLADAYLRVDPPRQITTAEMAIFQRFAAGDPVAF